MLRSILELIQKTLITLIINRAANRAANFRPISFITWLISGTWGRGRCSRWAKTDLRSTDVRTKDPPFLSNFFICLRLCPDVATKFGPGSPGMESRRPRRGEYSHVSAPRPREFGFAA